MRKCVTCKHPSPGVYCPVCLTIVLRDSGYDQETIRGVFDHYQKPGPIRRFAALSCAVYFFSATLVGICNSITPQSALSFLSGTFFLLGTLWDHRDIFQHVYLSRKDR